MATITISTEFLKTFGRRLYTQHPLEIAVRELLQNAVDACIAESDAPKHKIRLSLLYSTSGVSLVCSDTGIGMSADDIVSRFLQVGSSAKTTGIGGFGIAKLALFLASNWSVHSRDNYVDSAIISDNGDIRSVRYRRGTIITLNYDYETVMLPNFRRIENLIKYSDIPDNISVILEINTGDIRKIKPTYAKIKNEFSDFSDSAYFRISSAKLVEQSKIVRLNGLVTHQEPISTDTSIIVDIFPSVRPADDNYPLSASRESIRDAYINAELRRVYEKLSIDKLSATDESRMTKNTEISMFSVELEKFVHLKIEIPQRGRKRQMLSNFEISVLNIIHKIAKIVDYQYERREYGLILSDSTLGENVGKTKIYINPKIFAKTQTEYDVIMSVLGILSHELTHDYYNYHDEYFSSRMTDIFANSGQFLAKILGDKQLMKDARHLAILLRNRNMKNMED